MPLYPRTALVRPVDGSRTHVGMASGVYPTKSFPIHMTDLSTVVHVLVYLPIISRFNKAQGPRLASPPVGRSGFGADDLA